MDSISLKVSSSFPEGHGDLCVSSVDNHIFYIHRSALQHASSVFGTVFERGTEDDDQKKDPIKLEADGKTLETVLRLLYSNREATPVRDTRQLAAIFRFAKRYEMDGIFHLLRKEMLAIRVVGDSIIHPLYVTDPISSLIIAHAFDCEAEARLALRECVKGALDSQLDLAGDFDIPVHLMQTILRLRNERVQLLVDKLKLIPMVQNGCIHCATTYDQWRGQILSSIQREPSFLIFKNSIKTTPITNCAGGHASVNQTNLSTNLSTWSTEFDALELTLPTLPRIPLRNRNSCV